MRLTLPQFDRPAVAPGVALDTGPRSIGAVKVLRISVTDRCNYRCVYCMPEDGVRWLPKDDILSFEEIADVVRAAVEVHGIRRFKLTGGEPTVRHGIVDLVARLRAIHGVTDLSLTTNGQRLTDLAVPLKHAGLDRVTVSLDSLRPDRFRAVTRTGDLAAVLRGLDACAEAGFGSLKVNVVTMRGTNDDEAADFARLTLDRALTVRFIEYMPLGDAALMHPATDAARRITGSTADASGTLLAGSGSDGSSIRQRGNDDSAIRRAGIGSPPPPNPTTGFNIGTFPTTPRVADSESGPAGGCGAQDRGPDAFVSETEVRDRIESELGRLHPVDRDTEAGVGPAVVYRLGGASGRVGFISAMSAPFCATCNRLRLTADGTLRSCLFEGGEVDVRSILRGTAATTTTAPSPPTRRDALAVAMAECVRLKPDVHTGHGNRQMSQIGG